ncbi:MAG: ATP-binding protein [Bacillota bacterium]|nr:ATP-binding protein [Bacillota bacterium]
MGYGKPVKNKRTLKRRIRKLIAAVNFYSLLVMLVALMLIFGTAVSFFGRKISMITAEQMSSELEKIWPSAVKQMLVGDNFPQRNVSSDNNDSNRIFRILGERYMLSTGIEDHLQNLDNPNIKAMLEDSGSFGTDFNDISLIDYKIYKDKVLIYSYEDDKGIPDINKIKAGKIMNFLSEEVTVPVNIDGVHSNVELLVRLNPVLIMFGFAALLLAGLLIFFITLMIARILARPFTSMIVKPLTNLESKINNLAEGRIESAMGTEIQLKKPIREVENLANSTNKIMSKMSEYVGLLENQKYELEAQNNTLEDNSSALTSMNSALANRHSKLKNILDHVEQGLLTFNKSLVINYEYSQECERIFSGKVSQNKLSSLLYESDDSMQSFIDDLLLKIFDSEEGKRPLYISLLPEEVLIEGKNISVSYKIVKDEKDEDIMMVILSDITEKRKLEKKMDEERSILKMVVKTIINRNEFLQLSGEYKSFCEEDFNGLQKEDFDEWLRKIHTFKGNFSQFDMISVVKQLDELENSLYSDTSYSIITDLNGKQLYSWLSEDLNIIETYTGSDFSRDEEIFYIKKSKLTEIEEKLKKVLSAYEYKTVLPMIKSLCYKSVKELLAIYPAYIEKLSQRIERPVRPLEISGDEVLIDTNYYGEVTKSLVHIFRNCVDHGIENEDERLEKGKEQMGTIRCMVKDLADNFSITISDDGRGIDVPLLEQKCLERNVCSEEELHKMNHDEKMDLIFKQGLSTKDSATSISGRGVGMPAVKEAVENAGGNIEVYSEKDVYTSFIITLPKIEEKTDKAVTPYGFMMELLKTTRKFVAEQTGITLTMEDIKEENIISLNKITSLISLKGSINSIVMISANDAMAGRLVEGFLIEKVSDVEKEAYAEDVLGEICNNILGNTFGAFEDDSDIFQISVPAMISNKGAYLKYTNSDILTCSLEENEFKLNISILLLQDETTDNLRGV